MNETEIFMLTGCLSTCYKFDYDIHPLTNLRAFETTSLFNSFMLKFVIPTTRYEEKEQVHMGM